MSTQILHDGRLQLEAWGLAEFVREFQELVKDGWIVNLDDNDGFPVNIGGLMHAKLVKVQPCEDFLDETEVSEEKDAEMLEKAKEVVLTEEKTAKIEAPKRGRPAKG